MAHLHTRSIKLEQIPSDSFLVCQELRATWTTETGATSQDLSTLPEDFTSLAGQVVEEGLVLPRGMVAWDWEDWII